MPKQRAAAAFATRPNPARIEPAGAPTSAFGGTRP